MALKTPLKSAALAAFPGATPDIRAEPALPGTMENGQGFVVLVGGGKGGGHCVGSIVTVTSPAASVEDFSTFEFEGLVTSTPRTTPEPPGETSAK